MEKLIINAQTREPGRKTLKEIRKKGYIPGIVYGPKSKNRSIKIGEMDFGKVFNKAGESTLIDLKVDDKEIGKVIIYDYQTDPIRDFVTHVDLYQVRMDKKINAHVAIQFFGESPAVKNEGGVLVKSHNKLEIKCLPKDLIHNIEVDIFALANLNDVIRVKDLKVSKEIEIIAEPEEVIISVIPPRTEKEMEELESEVKEEVEKVETAKVKEEKEEEKEEGAEKEPLPQTKPQAREKKK